MSRRDFLGYLLVNPQRTHAWVSGGLLPLTRLTRLPPMWEDSRHALKVARALRKVLGLRLTVVSAWAP
jgi:hypothetical protein